PLKGTGGTHADRTRGDILLSVRLHRGGGGLHGHLRAQSGTLRAVPDPDLLQRRGTLPADGRRVPGDDPSGGLCRRGRGAVPLRGDDARRRFRRAEAGRVAIRPDRRAGGADPRRRADHSPRRLHIRASARHAGRAADPGARRAAQHAGAGRHSLHGLPLLLPDRRADPAGGDDRRDRADAAPQAGRQAPGHQRAGSPHAADGDRGEEGRDGQGYLTMEVGISHFLTVSAILFTLGVFGIFLNRKNVIVILMSVELILLAVNINFVAFSAALGDLVGQLFARCALWAAAAAAALGLPILVVFFRNRGSIDVEDVNMMKR